MIGDLQRVKSVDCPKCGYNATRLVGAGTRFGKPWARYECDFCGKRFIVGHNPTEPGISNGVEYRTTRCECPKCGTKNPSVKSTQGRIRFHLCGNCGQRFKSVESD